jgi:branched-subunit amino acid aminotransferase/4-amino-4-deoxychorismate lyase
MKAYKDQNGKIRLFRPEMNMARMNRSTARIALPVSALMQSFPPRKKKLIDKKIRILMAMNYSRLLENF